MSAQQHTSSVTDLFPNTAYIAFLQILTNRSHTPTKVRCCGWVELPSDSSSNSMFFDPFFVPCRNTLCKLSFTSIKFVPFSLMVVHCSPLRAINFTIAMRQLSVSNFGTTSICTALIVRQVNRQHHRFSFLRPIFTRKGPN